MRRISDRPTKTIMSYARFVQEKYIYIILTTLIVVVIGGLFMASPGVYIRQANTPLIVIMMTAMNFKGLEMLPVAVGFAFQMLTAVTFYQLFRRAMTEKDR